MGLRSDINYTYDMVLFAASLTPASSDGTVLPVDIQAVAARMPDPKVAR